MGCVCICKLLSHSFPVEDRTTEMLIRAKSWFREPRAAARQAAGGGKQSASQKQRGPVLERSLTPRGWGGGRALGPVGRDGAFHPPVGGHSTTCGPFRNRLDWFVLGTREEFQK